MIKRAKDNQIFNFMIFVAPFFAKAFPLLNDVAAVGTILTSLVMTSCGADIRTYSLSVNDFKIPRFFEIRRKLPNKIV